MKIILALMLLGLTALPVSAARPTKIPFVVAWYGLHERTACFPHNTPCGFEGLRMVAVVHNSDPDCNGDGLPILRVTSMMMDGIVQPLSRTIGPLSYTYIVSDPLPKDRDWSKVTPTFEVMQTLQRNPPGLPAYAMGYSLPDKNMTQGFWVSIENDRPYPVERVGVLAIEPEISTDLLPWPCDKKYTYPVIAYHDVLGIWWYEHDVALPPGGRAQVKLFDYLHPIPFLDEEKLWPHARPTFILIHPLR